MKPTITVIGAGIGGLTLSTILHKYGIIASIYELETSPAVRDEGGVLDLHEKAGQRALHKAGLFDKFKTVARYEAQETRMVDKNGKVYFSDSAEHVFDEKRPEIERGSLRNMLLQSVPPDSIHWGYKVIHIEKADDKKFRITFSNKETIETQILIGADGAWSRVRQLLSIVKPVYAGVSYAEMHLNDVDKRHSAIASFIGPGSLYALSDEKVIHAQRNGSNQIRIYAYLKVPEQWATNSEITSKDTAAKIILLKHFTGWNSLLKECITESEANLILRPLYSLPVGHKWKHAPNATLLGDAAHLMAPFSGEGVNLAMLDGAELAEAISAHPEDIEKAFLWYEQRLFSRSKIAAKKAADNLREFFSPHVLENLDKH
jgi:2-polyprenyl-6-methoxyphenol hydroxylase-like FAD-dependent oxidoreductase